MLFALITAPHAVANPTKKIRLAAPIFPPYIFQTNNKWDGVGYHTVNKILNNANITYEIIPVGNYGKALDALIKGKVDGFFPATQNPVRDQHAQFSQPILINRWVWYMPNSEQLTPDMAEFKQQRFVSTPFKSNTHVWLSTHGYKVKGTLEIDNLPNMLLKKRLDAVLISQLVFETSAKNHKIPMHNFKQIVHSEKGFGIYLSKATLKNKPELLKRINQSIVELDNNH
ncbi:hypothetical protein XM47_12170 [Catenovulum maritimum]|uniref:Solute-binding protein family 3/N-terminal domain-containing protein n=2 Tax=Catenovulum maritimum TaxID=1513271 RepID=A0A0J8GVV3_9ALTE|nr:hypothetical protein XM47_12170 [Catenovulum maritimum]